MLRAHPSKLKNDVLPLARGFGYLRRPAAFFDDLLTASLVIDRQRPPCEEPSQDYAFYRQAV
jgi:hypothetical protein